MIFKFRFQQQMEQKNFIPLKIMQQDSKGWNLQENEIEKLWSHGESIPMLTLSITENQEILMER